MKEEDAPSAACLVKPPEASSRPSASRRHPRLPRPSAADDRHDQAPRLVDVRASPRPAGGQARLDARCAPEDLEPLARHLGALLGAAHRRGAKRVPTKAWTARARDALAQRHLPRRHPRGDVPRLLRARAAMTGDAARRASSTPSPAATSATTRCPPTSRAPAWQRVLRELPAPPARVLDLGVGTGRELTALLDAGLRAHRRRRLARHARALRAARAPRPARRGRLLGAPALRRRLVRRRHRAARDAGAPAGRAGAGRGSRASSPASCAREEPSSPRSPSPPGSTRARPTPACTRTGPATGDLRGPGHRRAHRGAPPLGRPSGRRRSVPSGRRGVEPVGEAEWLVARGTCALAFPACATPSLPRRPRRSRSRRGLAGPRQRRFPASNELLFSPSNDRARHPADDLRHPAVLRLRSDVDAGSARTRWACRPTLERGPQPRPHRRTTSLIVGSLPRVSRCRPTPAAAGPLGAAPCGPAGGGHRRPTAGPDTVLAITSTFETDAGARRRRGLHPARLHQHRRRRDLGLAGTIDPAATVDHHRRRADRPAAHLRVGLPRRGDGAHDVDLRQSSDGGQTWTEQPDAVRRLHRDRGVHRRGGPAERRRRLRPLRPSPTPRASSRREPRASSSPATGRRPPSRSPSPCSRTRCWDSPSRPDGSKVYLGGPNDGLFLASSADLQFHQRAPAARPTAARRRFTCSAWPPTGRISGLARTR